MMSTEPTNPGNPPSAPVAADGTICNAYRDAGPAIHAACRLAMEECQKQIDYFTTHAKLAYVFLRLSQTLIVILSATTPVLLLAEPAQLGRLGSDPETVEANRRLIAALLSAVVAVVTGLNAAFKWQEEWVRSAFAREALTSERIKFGTRAEWVYAGDPGEAIATFVQRAEALRLAEVTEWKEYELATIAQRAGTDEQLASRLEERVSGHAAGKGEYGAKDPGGPD